MHFQWHEILRRGEKGGKQEPSSVCLMSKQKEEKIISVTVTGKNRSCFFFFPTARNLSGSRNRTAQNISARPGIDFLTIKVVAAGVLTL